MPRVLVAVDENEESVRAARVAHALFGDAEYLAVYVADPAIDMSSTPWWGAGWGVGGPLGYGAVWPYPVRTTAEEDAMRPGDAAPQRTTVDDAIEDARAVADRSGLPGARPVGDVGDPADAILRAADAHHADVIVVGTRQRSWFQRLLEPSVSGEIVKQAEIPVLVVK